MSDAVSDRGLLLLVGFADGGDKHGYTLARDIEEFAGVTLGPGTLYGALAKLEDDGLIEPRPADGRRRPYRITPLGLEVLGETLAENKRIARLGLERIAQGDHRALSGAH